MRTCLKPLAIGLSVAFLSALAITRVPLAAADSCDAGDIIPPDWAYSYSTLPVCDDEAVIIPTFPGDPVGYTSPGNTPFVNGQPVITPFSNISVYTPDQAATARANGDPTATSNAYSQYGGFTKPGDTASKETSASYIISGN